MGAYLSADCLDLALLRGQGHGFADGQHGLPAHRSGAAGLSVLPCTSAGFTVLIAAVLRSSREETR